MRKYDSTLAELAKEKFQSGARPKQVAEEIHKLVPGIPKSTIYSWIYPRHSRTDQIYKSSKEQMSFTSEQIVNAIVDIKHKNEQLCLENKKLLEKVDKLEKSNYAIKVALKEAENKSLSKVKLQIEREISLQARE